jgi:hypothetical protein
MRRLRLLAVTSAVMLLFVGIVGPAQAVGPSKTVEGEPSANETPTPTIPSGGHFAPYDQGTVSPNVESSIIVAGTCHYTQATDYIHKSSTGDAASVHGFWRNYSGVGTCPSTATVTVYLQAWWCDDYPYSCYWATLTVGQADVYNGGGGGNRATARWDCASDNVVGWRAFVDVDLDNWSDPAGYTYTDPVNLACSPS